MIQRVKEICSYVSRGCTPDYVDDSPYAVMNQATFSKGYLDTSKLRFSSKNPEEAHILKGDLLMASTGGGVLGKVLFFDDDTQDNFYADSHVSILRDSRHKNNMKFLYYYFLTRYDEINATMVKGSTNQTELQRNYLITHEIDIPEKDRQNAIVAYLDKQINSINERICLRERELQTLIKLKQSEINSVVTRGLNPAVPMKDSGIDWIGQIPAHWQVRQLKSCVNINNGRDYKDIEVEEGEGYPVLGSGGVFAYASQYMYDGEVLLLGRKGTIDKPQYYNGKFWAVDTIFYAIPSRGVICKFMYYLSLTLPIKKFSTATALPSMTQTEYGKILVPLPPLEEQRAIVDYLDGKYERIDAFIANINAQIDKLKLLKKALINEVVTGQRPITQ